MRHNVLSATHYAPLRLFPIAQQKEDIGMHRSHYQFVNRSLVILGMPIAGTD